MRDLHFKQLQSFLVLAEELNFRRASERLNIAQPALSRQIQKLEGRMGVSLLERTRHGVTLTASGKYFSTVSRRVIRDLDHYISTTRRIAEGRSGSLSVGFVGSSSYVLLPAILRRFRSACPDVELQLMDLNNNDQMGALKSGRIDVGLVRPGSGTENMLYETILIEPFVIVLPEKDRYAGARNISLRRFAEYDFIFHERVLSPAVTSICELTMELFRKAKVQPKVVRESPPQMHAILGLVAAGFGAALLPCSLMQKPIAGLDFATLVERDPQSEIGVALPEKNKENHIVRKFIESAKLAGQAIQDSNFSQLAV